MADGLIPKTAVDRFVGTGHARDQMVRGHGPLLQASTVFLGLCLLSSVFYPLNAEELPDPTRPPASISAPVVAPAGGAAVKQSAGLQSIIISKTRRAAIIDGESVELGGKHGDVKLIEVNEGSVVLRGTQGRQVLTLFPDVKITSKEEVKANPDSPASKVQSGKQKNRPAAHKEKK